LTTLSELYLHHNQFSGGIPIGIYDIVELSRLYMNDNDFTGPIASDISNLQNLERLRLQNNNISGTLPDEICLLNLDWDNQISFNISNNNLCSSLPLCVNGFEGQQDTTNCNQMSSKEELYPLSYEIKDAYPNPFNPIINLIYSIPSKASVSIVISDLLGREVKVLHSGYQDSGERLLQWDATDQNGRVVGTGIYYCTLFANQYRNTIKIVLVK